MTCPRVRQFAQGGEIVPPLSGLFASVVSAAVSTSKEKAGSVPPVTGTPLTLTVIFLGPGEFGATPTVATTLLIWFEPGTIV